ncbi:unnamed protein product [Acanthoscelides obtectus]|uniref:Uncharacterized protein n=1 Tax=Acanthoscelides obtectus TaxID=200917 RepID=A0A9P0QH13_ACAOB|nr:unnamed protein product [Acanthoscelides obtectus]CAK1682547.1 hypothetical protein AOBTE_LOCUS33706 [Acanthoscelides obtectus]
MVNTAPYSRAIRSIPSHPRPTSALETCLLRQKGSYLLSKISSSQLKYIKET